jgi:hypothetical protein
MIVLKGGIMKPIQDKEKPGIFNFLRTLADYLENRKPPYVGVQKIAITKIDDGHHHDYEAVVEESGKTKLMGDGGKTCRHREDCTWDDMGLK